MISYDTVLVTGAGGWIGSSVTRRLLGNAGAVGTLERLRVLVIDERDLAPDIARGDPRLEVVTGDVRDYAAMLRFTDGMQNGLLIHCAGVVHPKRIGDFYSINLDGTRHVLKAAIHAGVRRAVIISSNSAFGTNAERTDRFDEASPFDPYMNYGRSKMLAEQHVRLVAESDRIETVVVRPPWFYGPHAPARQAEFFRLIRDGRLPMIGDGGNQRSMVYIDNLVQGLLLAGGVEAAAGRTYWIADAQPYAMEVIIGTIRRLLESEFGIPCRRPRTRLPDAAGAVATQLDALTQSLGLYVQKLHVLSELNKTIACSIDRARHELGYAPAIALEEGMRRSIGDALTAGRTLWC